MTDSTQVRYVTEHFEMLQGLAMLPAIAWCGLAMSWAAGWVNGWTLLPGALVAALAVLAAVAHYRRTYGQVRQRYQHRAKHMLLWPVTGLLTVAALVHALDLALPVSLETLILSVGALAGARFERPLAPALLLIGCAGTVLSLLPLGGPAGPHPLSVTEHWIIAFITGTAVLAGWSHLLLRRTLGQ
ncbi:hypothetical protein GCM10027280_25230 [Micromonospora polyrhachis]|uniref:Uncharacterized protein n=1 Tax=Micromonospora polyrhachis TaxID=1282883 RepID=A0A7W7SSY0_9ACTN|nr:hypothetical protein [Micromonospora polyrhachis]MBB4960385.1 hypothetical protein [Micromonospora polyrhachis]